MLRRAAGVMLLLLQQLGTVAVLWHPNGMLLAR
jgi:hypothetical protein